MSGHGAGSRLLVFARKPAPVQVKWVGCQVNTTGMDAMDYFISDSVEPPPEDEQPKVYKPSWATGKSRFG